MKVKIVKFIRNNGIILVPSSFAVLLFIGFLIFGLAKPETITVLIKNEITIEQQLAEERFVNDYNEKTYNELDPFFVLNPFDIAPLSGLLIFESATEQQYQIVIKGKEIEGDIEFVSTNALIHYIPIYGLYPDYINTIEVYEYIDETVGELLSSTLVKTDKLPNQVVSPTTIETTYDYFNDDLMILTPALDSLPIGVDYNGDIRWYLSSRLSFNPVILSNGHLLLASDKLIGDPYYATGLYEMDYLGKVYREYIIPGGYHHDATELPGGNLLVLTSDFEGSVEDKIVEVERNSGEIVDYWNVETLLPKEDGQSAMNTTFDWFHNTSIYYDEVTDSILLSGAYQDIVISIDKTTHQLNYVLGDPVNWSEFFSNQYFFTPIGENFEWQYAQNDAMVTVDGQIFILDNGTNKSKIPDNYVPASNTYSRAVLYDINTTDMTIEQVYQFGTELGNEFYSSYLSNVEYYELGHYLIHSGGHIEVDGVIQNLPKDNYSDLQVVTYKSMTYEIVNDEVMYYLEVADNFYAAKRVSLYTNHTNYITGRGLTLGSLVETEKFDQKYDIKFSFFDTVPAFYQVDLTKYAHRFEVKGQFDTTDEVYVKLVNNTNTFIYYIPTNNEFPNGVALVSYIDEDQYITYFINETNIEGDFQVYLVINGREYNTYRHVLFN